MNHYILLLLVSLFGLLSCSESPDTASTEKQAAMSKQKATLVSRWYSQRQVREGGPLFQKYCAECHKPDASGTTNWRQPDITGKYPPPPLNGSAHTWHHHLDGLRRTVRMGGIPLGGSMPAFGDKLNNREIDAVLAWVQSHWPDETYAAWHKINAQGSR